MKRKYVRKLVALSLATVLAAETVCSVGSASVLADTAEETTDTADESASSSDAEYSSERLSTNYTKVSAGYTAAEYAGETKVISIADSISEDGAGLLTTDSYDYGSSVCGLTIGDTVSLTVDVPETALYQIGFDYLS
jgi:hypothetical protein